MVQQSRGKQANNRRRNYRYEKAIYDNSATRCAGDVYIIGSGGNKDRGSRSAKRRGIYQGGTVRN
jgi:hypothetical protein